MVDVESKESLALGDITVGDLLAFAHWIHGAQTALENGGSLPAKPSLQTQAIAEWMTFIERLEKESRQIEARQKALQGALAGHTEELEPLVYNLCENLAVLYESFGEREKANAVRLRTAALSVVP